MSNGKLKHRIFIGITPVIDPPPDPIYWLFEDQTVLGDDIIVNFEDDAKSITEDS